MASLAIFSWGIRINICLDGSFLFIHVASNRRLRRVPVCVVLTRDKMVHTRLTKLSFLKKVKIAFIVNHVIYCGSCSDHKI